jgi:hypothetical protein
MEILTVDGENSTYKWSDGTVVSKKITQRIANGTFTLERRTTRDSVPLALLASAYIGRVNNVKFEDFNPTEVLFEGITTTQYENPDGKTRFKVTMMFHWREISWQYLFRERTGEWEDVTPSLYETKDLNDLKKARFF